jgi:hypothetical protein
MIECIPKVAELRQRFPNKNIEVDGGVGPSNIHTCAEAGKCLPTPYLVNYAHCRVVEQLGC